MTDQNENLSPEEQEQFTSIAEAYETSQRFFGCHPELRETERNLSLFCTYLEVNRLPDNDAASWERAYRDLAAELDLNDVPWNHVQ